MVREARATLCGYKHVRLTLEEFINAVGLVKRIAPEAILNDDFKITFAYHHRIKFNHENIDCVIRGLFT